MILPILPNRCSPPWAIIRCVNLRPRKCIIQLPLPVLVSRRAQRIGDVRDDSAELRAATIYPEKLSHGQAQPAQFIAAFAYEAAQIHERLNRSFPESRLPYDDATVIILDRSGKDFRSGSAVSIDQHSQRAGIDGFRIRIFFNFNFAAGILYLHYRTAGNEETG